MTLRYSDARGTLPGPLTGIWLSSYEYESTGRGATFTNRH